MVLDRIAVLGKESDPADLVDLSTLDRLSTGQFVSAPTNVEGTVALYRRDGVFQALLSKAGMGPNELVRADVVRVGKGDTIVVYEGAINRETRLLPNGVVVARRKLAYVPKAYRFANTVGGIVISEYVRQPDQIGYAFHLIGPSGDFTRSFGAFSETRVTVNGPVPSRRLISASVDGGFWAIASDKFAFEHWTSTGDLVQRLTPTAEWYVPPPSTGPAGQRMNGGRAVTRVYAVYEDPDRRLWSFASVERTPSPQRSAKLREHETVADGPTLDRTHETIIQVMESRSGRTIAYNRIPGLYYGPFPSGLVSRRLEADDGFVQTAVFSLSLTPSKGVRQ